MRNRNNPDFIYSKMSPINGSCTVEQAKEMILTFFAMHKTKPDKKARLQFADKLLEADCDFLTFRKAQNEILFDRTDSVI